WRDGQRGWVRAAIAVAVWAVVALGARWLNDALTDTVTERPQVELATADLAGMLRYGPDLDDAELQRVLAGAPLAVQSGIQAHARARSRETDAAGEPVHLFEPAQTAAQRAAVIAARRSLARAHPAAYLAARWHAFYRVLGLSRAPRDAVYTRFLESAIQRYAVGQVSTHGWTQEQLNKWARYVGRTWLCRPVVYLVLALVLLPFAVRGRQREIAMMLASGLACEASQFVLASTAEYRLSHWMILCAWLAAVAMLPRPL